MSLFPAEKSYTYLVTTCLRNASVGRSLQSMRRPDARRRAGRRGVRFNPDEPARRTRSRTRGGIDGAREGQGREQERQEEGPEERQGETGREEGEEGNGHARRRRMTLRRRAPLWRTRRRSRAARPEAR